MEICVPWRKQQIAVKFDYKKGEMIDVKKYKTDNLKK